jgi:putative flippase GtrA
VTRLPREALGYAAVSLVSLAIDVTILAFLVQVLQWGNLVAAATSFLAGACVAYALSVHFVFTQHRLRNRRAEFAGFVAIGVLGLAINIGVIYLCIGYLGMQVLTAKALAAAFSFSCNFVARRQALFVSSSGPPAVL